jgi:AraC-like DNA-binding protein
MIHVQESGYPVDPLAEVVALLRPSAPTSKFVSGRGRWRVRRAEAGRPFFCVLLEGSIRLALQGRAPLVLEAGDFVLVPAVHDFVVSSADPLDDDAESALTVMADGEVRHGDPGAPPDVRMVVGYCVFASPHENLLVPLLPEIVHVRGERRLTTLVDLVREESLARRPARDVVMAHLLEVMLIEALRATAGMGPSPGLLRGLADDRIAVALRHMHEQPAHAWTVAELAADAALSRSAFFDRFHRTVGVAPMEYLLGWRMALAKELLRDGSVTVAEAAARVGYGSASSFSVAFTRHVGVPPAHYRRAA